MKRLLLILVLIAAYCYVGAFLTETASLENFLIRSEPNCAYDNWVSHVSEGIAIQSYNLYAPYDRQTNGFGDFRVPTTAELVSWGGIVDLFLAGMLSQAQSAIITAGFPYQVVHFNDTDTGRIFYMLREIPNYTYSDDNGTEDTYDDELGAFAYGWGLYIYDPTSTRPIIITVPHPTDDFATPIMGYDALTTWNASYLLIAGAGREVKWTNVGTFTNAKSLSDPTRLEAHPYNVAYQKFADKIRLDYGKREFSFQIHSYDWNRHQGYTDNQISAGYNKLCPNLPIRDLSSLKKDLINKGSHLMIPANTIGIHSDVFLNQYYSVNYNIHNFTFSDGEYEYPVNDYVDLPAYSLNRQMLYTLNGWNDYDSFEPFFHIEMDELPNVYEETENTYKWFYGWNEATGQWDMDNLFSNYRSYYKRWVVDMNSLYDDMFAMNDGMIPPAPTNLTVANQSMYYTTLSWTKSDSYDFDSYEILYSTTPITGNEQTRFDRNNNSFLASLDCQSVNVTGLSNTNNYYFKIRAKDKNGNYSPLSNEVTSYPAPANVTSFTAHGMHESVRIAWSLGGQSGFLGFKVLRREVGGEFVLLDSYLTNNELVAGNNNYEYWDTGLTNNIPLEYRIVMVNSSNIEFVHNVPGFAEPKVVYGLKIRNSTDTLNDTFEFSQNPYATDGNDNFYDVTKDNPTTSYVWIAGWQQYWGNNGTHLSREVKGGYDLNTQLKSWTMRVRSDQLGTPLFIEIPSNVSRAEKLYLYDAGNGTWHNLLSGPYQFTVANSNARAMTLYWGDLQPYATHNAMANRVLQGGNTVNFSWNNQYSFLINTIDVYLKNGADSLAVLLNAPSSTNSYSYTVPQSIDMQNAKLHVDLVAIDGVRKTYKSPYTLAFVPRFNLLYNEPGWQTKTNPFLETSFTIEQIFGTGSLGYVLNDAWQWDVRSSYDFGYSYWINGTDYLFNSTTSSIVNEEVLVPITPGWNFVSNPHLCAYNVNSIRFTINGNVFRYSEMIAQQLISRGVYVYREGAYHLVNMIQPYESFFIKSYANANMLVNISFYPFFEAPQITPPSAQWNVSVTANGVDNDSFKIGGNPIATDDYDFRLDLPKPPEKNLFQGTSIYLTRMDIDDVNFRDQRLQEEYQSTFSTSELDERLWNFSLEVPDTQPLAPVTFNFSTFGVQPDWTLRFVLEGTPFTITDGSSTEFFPSSAGTFNGYIRVNNQPVSNSDLINQPISSIRIFPNPFNPTSTIAFTTINPKDISVDVYNVRGQKVKTIHKGSLPAGNHQLQWNGVDENGRSVASGLYFTRIKDGNNVKVIKMMLMK